VPSTLHARPVSSASQARIHAQRIVVEAPGDAPPAEERRRWAYICRANALRQGRASSGDAVVAYRPFGCPSQRRLRLSS
jgi:hypothetical protein